MSGGQGVIMNEDIPTMFEAEHPAGDVKNNKMETLVNVKLKKNQKIKFKETEDADWKEGTVLQRAGKVGGKYDGWYNVQLNNQSRDLNVLDMNNVDEWDKILVMMKVKKMLGFFLFPKNDWETKK